MTIDGQPGRAPAAGPLAGKVAVVTGGTRGLGRAIARRLLDDGAAVVCAARSGEPVKDLLEDEPDRAAFVAVDVADPESVRSMFEQAVGRFGGVDVIVTCAAVKRPGRAEALEPDAWSAALGTNLDGTFHCIHYGVPHLLARGGGRIVTVSSTLGQRPTEFASTYCVSKAAVEMLTRVTALELGGRGITVNCLSPGVTDAGMSEDLARDEKMWAYFAPKFATGRPGAAGEVAAAAAFLAGPESSYVNGVVLPVDGGMRW